MTFHTRLRLPILLAALLAVAALAALTGLPTSAAQAQGTEVTLVSNTGQTASAGGYSLNAAFAKRAQGFTTGADALGYRLTSIGVRFGTIDASADPASELSATLNAASSGDPGDAICTLTPPDSYTADSVNTYTAPDDCGVLSSGTSYFVVIERHTSFTGAIKLDATAKIDEDADAAEGWSIANDRYYVSSGAWTSSAGPQMIEAKGSPVTRLLVSNTGQTSSATDLSLTSATARRAQAFTTGPTDADYDLGSIGITFGDINNTATASGSLTATVNENDSGNPGDVVCTLMHPASYAANSVNSYAAPEECPALEASTTYFFVLTRHTNFVGYIGLKATFSDDEDSDTPRSIANDRRHFQTSWSSSSQKRSSDPSEGRRIHESGRHGRADDHRHGTGGGGADS